MTAEGTPAPATGAADRGDRQDAATGSDAGPPPAPGPTGRDDRSVAAAAGPDAGPPTVRTRGTVVIDVDACKGCDLCIDACPPRVLVMTGGDQVNSRGYRYPQLLPGCTGCKACSQICPDFVFQVYKYETPREIPT